ncbi:MAG: ABC transporter ATP-binding protein [Ignavibacteriae bacterium]|nr:ABC transporter ATP-binding protein [Ignavibacteria bacterium]MBI3364618.1 ABC transporter ATP-binding protein [Ignavibacteriota bacterium]
MISVHNVSKVFRIPHAKKNTLYHNILSTLTKSYDYESFFAVNDVSFHITAGEFVGIVGRNGSGKSTLLKILSGIYQPTTGDVHVNDDLFPLLELGVGFQSDFTVRDNIYLYGSLLGFSRTEMKCKTEEILDFAELTRFADARLEKLSTGMQMRLGFTIAIQSVAPIMLVDEVLAVGDKAFADKCKLVFWDLKNRGTTVLFVSHDLESVIEYCTRVILMDSGHLIDQGEPNAMVDYYTHHIVGQ